jgi:hypothetical protein
VLSRSVQTAARGEAGSVEQTVESLAVIGVMPRAFVF